jgi:hypothetical protein
MRRTERTTDTPANFASAHNECMKLLIVVAFVAILFALGAAGRAMLQDGREGQVKSNRMVRALTWRIGISVALFVFILLGYKLGWIHPTGIRPGQ